MTTGNVTNHIWSQSGATCSGPNDVYRKSVKSWSGADAVAPTPIYDILKRPSDGRYVRKARRDSRILSPNNYNLSFSFTDRQRLDMLRRNPPGCGAFFHYSQAANCWTAHSSYGANPWSSNDDLKLLSKLHEKVWGSSFDPAVFLAEGKQSLEMIASAATRITRSAMFAKRGDYRRAWLELSQTPRHVPHSTKKSMANIWAEYRWGWTPLMSDMHEGAEWLSHQLNAPAVFRLQVRREKQTNVGSAASGPNATGWSSANGVYRRRKQIIAYLSEPPVKSVYTGMDPLSVAWELVPYSFVVDWFIPIGSYLQMRGLPSTLRGTFVTSELSMTQGTGTRFHGFFCRWDAGRDLTFGLGPLSNATISGSFTRTVSNSLAIPKPTFKGFGQVASWKHAVDSLALLTQKLKG